MSELKKKLGNFDCIAPELPQVKDDGKVLLEPKAILDFCWRKSDKKILQEALVHWVGTAEEDATWELLPDLQQRFP